MAQFDPNRHHRRSIRLKGYDYTQLGAYFVTICIQNRDCFFGTVADDTMVLNAPGDMIQTEWEQLVNRFPTMRVDEYVVMPNHFHAILFLIHHDGVPTDWAPTRDAPTEEYDEGNESVGAGLVPAQKPVPRPPKIAAQNLPTVGEIVGAYKSITTHRYIQGVRQHGWPEFDRRLWQRNYYEHIIRDETSLERIRRYILANPANWESDKENPANSV